METATKPVNLFASAKKVEPKPTVKDKEKIIVPGTEKDLVRYSGIKIEESNLKTEKEMIRARLTEIGREVWLKKLAANKCRPESFQICDGAGKVLFIVEDRYKKLEGSKESELQAYPGVTENKTQFNINSEIFAKEGYGQLISDAIMNIEGIPDEDKLLLIEKEEVTVVKKGTINRLLTFPNYEQLFYLIEPTMALK